MVVMNSKRKRENGVKVGKKGRWSGKGKMKASTHQADKRVCGEVWGHETLNTRDELSFNSFTRLDGG